MADHFISRHNSIKPGVRKLSPTIKDNIRNHRPTLKKDKSHIIFSRKMSQANYPKLEPYMEEIVQLRQQNNFLKEENKRLKSKLAIKENSKQQAIFASSPLIDLLKSNNRELLRKLNAKEKQIKELKRALKELKLRETENLLNHIESDLVEMNKSSEGTPKIQQKKLVKDSSHKSTSKNLSTLSPKIDYQDLASAKFEILSRLYYLKVQDLSTFLKSSLKNEEFSETDLKTIFSSSLLVESSEDRDLLVSRILNNHSSISKIKLTEKLNAFLKEFKPLVASELSNHLKAALKLCYESLIRKIESKSSSIQSIITILDEHRMLSSDSDKPLMMRHLYSYNLSAKNVPYASAISDLIVEPDSQRSNSLQSTRNLGSSRATSLSPTE